MDNDYVDMLISVKSLLSLASCYIDRCATKEDKKNEIKNKLNTIINEALNICIVNNKEEILKRYVEFSVSDKDETLTTCLFINTHSSIKNLISLIAGYVRFLELPRDCKEENLKIVKIHIGNSPDNYDSGGVGIYTDLSLEQLLKDIFKFCDEQLNEK